MQIFLARTHVSTVARLATGVAASLLAGSTATATGQEPRPPESSRIVELHSTERAERKPIGGSGREEDFAGYRRPDMIGYIYQDRFELVPATGLDNMRYYAQLVGDLASECPALGLDGSKHALLPFLLSGASDLVRRFQTGQLTQSEVLQAVWMATLGLNRHWSCQYDPARDALDTAQARCNEASRASSKLGILPSFDAAHDLTLFLGRNACGSAESRHLARQLIAFGRIAHTRTHFTGQMPSPTSAAGRAYATIFDNCARTSIQPVDSAWCGCYVRTLHSLQPPEPVLEALAQNPFVDGSTYMTWVTRNLPGGEAFFECASVERGHLDWRESYAPRPTACLIGQRESVRSGLECRYRAAWGVFTLTADRCEQEISSRQWGYREVDCASGGRTATPPGGPREWKNGIFTTIDYESAVPRDFVPALPADARKKQPLQIRLLKRTTPGLLTSMSLTVPTHADLMILRVPFNLHESADPDIAALRQEGALLLKCTYKADKGVTQRMYWFERVPKHVQAGRVSPTLQRYFATIGAGVSTCPARVPE